MAKYTRLCYAERKRIEQLKSEGRGVRAIARILSRSHSSIFYELNRCFTNYNSTTTQRDAVANQKIRGKNLKLLALSRL